MKSMTLREVAEILETARLRDVPDGMVEGVSTDSRTVSKEDLFFAVRGDRFDGHRFVARALGRGAIAAVVERDNLEEIPAWCIPRLLPVDNSRKALMALSKAYRERMPATVVAVTGSCGKTTTKDVIHAVLSTEMRGVASQKSYNNDIGVPLTLFEMEEHHDFAVVEIGANAHGEIEELAEVVQPRIGVITNIRPVHLEGFGSIEGVTRAKCELLGNLSEKGVFVFNPSEPGLAARAKGFAGGHFTFGGEAGCTLAVESTRMGDRGLSLRMRGVDFDVPVLGRHNAMNICAGAAVGWIMGVPFPKMAQALKRFEGPHMRMMRSEVGTVTMIDDAYNANPASVLSAISTFSEMETKGRKILVLGDMMELGTRSLDFHRIIGRAAAEVNPDLTVSVGPLSGATASTMVARGVSSRKVIHLDETWKAASLLSKLLRAGDMVLLKASRRMGFERIREAIAARFTVPAVVTL